MANRAVQYARCSTDMQDQSVEDQITATSDYAAKNGYQIVRQPFVDQGRSGVTAVKRKGFMDMIHLIESGRADFDVILTYDVSRWGRFPDDDEAGYWQHHCKRNGVQVIYTHEPFSNERSLANSMALNLKRSMSSEYVRNLSKYVTRGQTSLSQKGFWFGLAPYALKRAEVDSSRAIVRVLAKGERKALKNHHTILVPGDPEEIAVVKRIFESCIAGYGMLSIADKLNQEKIPSPSGNLWCLATVSGILKNPVYAGTLVWGRLNHSKLSSPDNSSHDIGKGRFHDKDKWVTVEDVYAPIIDKKTFEKAQQAIASRSFEKKTGEYKRNGSQFLLSGLLVCEKCGDRYNGAAGNGYQRKIRWVAYGCNTARKKGKTACSSLKVDRRPIDQFVLFKIKAVVSNPEVWHLVANKIRDMQSSTLYGRDEQKQLQDRIVRVENAIKGLWEIVEDKTNPSWDLYNDRLNERRQERDELKLALLRLQNRKQETDSVADLILEARKKLEDVSKFLSDSNRYEPELNEIKKKLVKLFVYKGVVSPDRTTIRFYFYKVPIIGPYLNSGKESGESTFNGLQNFQLWPEREKTHPFNPEEYQLEILNLHEPMIEEDGKRWYRYTEYARVFNIDYTTVQWRVKRGWFDRKVIRGEIYIADRPEMIKRARKGRLRSTE